MLKLTLFVFTFLFFTNPVNAQQIEITKQGFAEAGKKLPHPEPIHHYKEYRTPWPRVVGQGQPQGYSLYPKNIQKLNLVHEDINQDGQKDLIYLHHKEKTLQLDIYFKTTNGTYASEKSIALQLPKEPEAVAPFFHDITQDGHLDLIVIARHKPSSLSLSKQGQYLIYEGNANSLFETEAATVLETDMPPKDLFFVKKNQQLGLLTYKSSLTTLSKKALSRFLMKKKITLKTKLMMYDQSTFKKEARASFTLPYEAPAKLLKEIQKHYKDWQEVPLPEILRWKNRKKTEPTIYYDWDRDGHEDLIAITHDKKHRIQSSSGKTLKTFQLHRSSLLTGAFLDLDAQNQFKEADLLYQKGASQDIPEQTQVKFLAPSFSKESIEESYTFKGLVHFPQSFADYDDDGDIDLFSLEIVGRKSLSLSQLFGKIIRKKRVQLNIYLREDGHYKRKPDLSKKIWLSLDQNWPKSFKELA